MTESVQAAAEQAPDAVQQHHDAAQQAQAVGDSAGANAHYQAELAARAGQPAPSPAAPTPAPDSSAGNGELAIADPNGYGPPAVVSTAGSDEVGYAQTALSPWSGWNGGPSIDDLFSGWGSDAGVNLGYASAFEDTHGDVAEVFMKWGLSGHPAVVEAAALMGRKYATRTGEMTVTDDTAPSTQPIFEGIPSARSGEGFAAQMRDFQRRIDQAQSEGNSRLANQIYAQQQSWIAAVKGNAPIVGSTGRTA